jgi:hypothetical protein
MSPHSPLTNVPDRTKRVFRGGNPGVNEESMDGVEAAFPRFRLKGLAVNGK